MRMPELRDVPIALARRTRRAVRPRVTPDRPTRMGLPDGIPADVLIREVVKETGAAPSEVRHQHLSGWKHAGAYRLLINTGSEQLSLIFKDAHYSAEHVTALEGLPVRPGPPELAVYASERGRLTARAPRALWWDEHLPGTRYLYLLEDLGRAYVTPTSSGALVSLCQQLPQIHDELRSAFDPAANAVLRYDGPFSEKLLVYVSDALERYARRQSTSRPVHGLLRSWERIERSYRSAHDDAFGRLAPRPLHGDLNLANVLVARDGSEDLRLLDWEWAGVGLPHFDLAAALKRASPALEERAVAAYGGASTDGESRSELWHTYQWCKLQRGLFDASFLARQQMDGTLAGRLDLDRHIEAAARRALRASRDLRNK